MYKKVQQANKLLLLLDGIDKNTEVENLLDNISTKGLLLRLYYKTTKEVDTFLDYIVKNTYLRVALLY